MKQRLLLSSLFVIGLVLTSFAQNNINQYEYWFDNSFESKTVANITPATLVNLSTSIPTTGLPAGLHTFQIRFGETTGTWSSTNIQFFIKTKSSSPNNGLISRYEYWFDNNYEDKTVQTVSQQSELTLASALSASQLSAGLHTFQIRFQESTGAWSSTTTQYFYKPKEIIDRSGNGIIAYRYWPGNEFNKSVDVDIDPVNPLILNNVIIPVSPSKKVNPNDYQFHPNPLTNHTVSSKNPLLLNFQFKDSIGEWGSPIVDSIIYT